jgi:hypothetical protein
LACAPNALSELRQRKERKPMAENQRLALADQRATSIRIYLGLTAIMVVLTGLTMFLPVEVNQGQRVTWLSVVIVALLGGVGLILTPKAGFPEMWDAHVSSRQRFWLPALIGLGFGTVAVLFDLVQPLGTQAQTKFPDSLVVFSLAGIIEEIIIHLFLTTLLIWLVSGLVFKGRHQEPVFWIIAAGGAVLYWLLQIGAIMAYFPERFTIALATQVFFIIFVTITAGAYLFRRGGFLAALSLRYGFYLVWHIIWGGGIGLVQYFMA